MSALDALPSAGRALAIVATAILWALDGHFGPERSAGLAAVAIVVLGLPHGSLDRLIAQGPLRAAPRPLLGAIGFALGYLAIAATVAAAWIAAPAIGLVGFLCLGMLHFGLCDRSAAPRIMQALQVIAHGGAPIVLLPVLHPEATSELFAILADREAADAILRGLQVVSPVWLVVTLVYAARVTARAEGRRRIAELALLSAAFAALPPLLGFLVYFGAVHAPRHLRAALRTLRSGAAATPTAITVELGAVSLAAAAGLAAAAVVLGGGSLDIGAVRACFIGLAALTVPHMILVDGITAARALRGAATVYSLK